jgi:membrane-associated phospholipid phosphatase
MRSICTFLAVLIFYGNAFCSSADSTVQAKIYHVNYPVVSVIIAGGFISDYYGVKRIKNKPSITLDELHFLSSQAQIDLINPFDRWGLRQKASDRDKYNTLSSNTLTGIVLVPCFLLLDKKIRKDWGDILLMYVEGHSITLANYCYNFLGPTYVQRFRPRTYYSEFTDVARESGQNRNSFYSGHVASAAYSTFFMAKVYCDYHPDLGAKKYLIYTAATIPPLLMTYLRIKALDHFPSDNLTGLVIGAAIGIIVPELHKYPSKKNLSFGMFTSPDAMGLSIYWKLQNKKFLTANK